MIHVVCGYMGAGKTTYVLNRLNSNCVIIDFDLLKEALNVYDKPILLKEIQRYILQEAYKYGKEIYYVTCYPNMYERQLFNDYEEIEYIWINTTMSKSLENAKDRDRLSDNIHSIKAINKRISNEYLFSDINFKIVTIFNNERW